MNYNELMLLLLLIMTLLILIFNYYINVCDNSVNEYFNAPTVGDYSCRKTANEAFPIGENTKTTYKAFKDLSRELNYHSDYTCDVRMGNKGVNNFIFSSDDSYTADISGNKLLLAYNCVDNSPTDIRNKLLEKNKFAENDLIIIGHDKCIIGSDKSLDDVILAELNGNLTGPIYACISQAPFLEGQSARDDILAHGTSCYIDNEDKYGKCDNETKKFKCHILLVKTYGLRDKIKEFVDFVNSNKTNDRMCHLLCHTDTNLGCGCLNLDNSYDFGGESYNSVCLGPDDQNTQVIAPVKNYSMIYFLNPYNTDANIQPWTKYEY